MTEKQREEERQGTSGRYHEGRERQEQTDAERREGRYDQEKERKKNDRTSCSVVERCGSRLRWEAGAYRHFDDYRAFLRVPGCMYTWRSVSKRSVEGRGESPPQISKDTQTRTHVSPHRARYLAVSFLIKAYSSLVWCPSMPCLLRWQYRAAQP